MLKCAIVCAIIFIATQVETQFWKMNALNQRDVFILETKATMASGICYKEVTTESTNPELRTQIYSYCCQGYMRNTKSIAMQCEPICLEDCTQGICTAPDECTCYPGYDRMGGRCEEL